MCEVATLSAEVKRLASLVQEPKRMWSYPRWTPEQIAAYQKRLDVYTREVAWFHSMDLGNGLQAKGATPLQILQDRWANFRLPENLTGRTFLDIGAWDGFFSFEAEQRGAKRVLATDYFCWGGAGCGKMEGFLLAREILGSKVEDMVIDADDISPERVGQFDIVLFSGIFYHRRDPIKSLQRAASVTEKVLVVFTHVGHENLAEPVMGYMPRVRGEENSNFWRPNPALLLQLLKEMGFPRGAPCGLRTGRPSGPPRLFPGLSLKPRL